MYQQIIFEEGKEPRINTSCQYIRHIVINDKNGKQLEVPIQEFIDARGEVFYAYFIAYLGKEPSREEIHIAIDGLKPIGEKFDMRDS
ncbi:MAG: hypothetical protein RR896_15930 [Citrobacter sp.]|uniref:hypothetical protein n=1 Tax=Citrobacter sp. TaxID=1896336 RepID=UPI002FC88E97